MSSRQWNLRTNLQTDTCLLYFVFVAVVTWFANFHFAVSDGHKILVLSIMLVVHNVIELIWLYRNNRKLWLINPIVIASVMNMLLFQGGITNMFLFEDGEFELGTYHRHLNWEEHWIVSVMEYTCYASVAMWLGYKLNWGRQIGVKTINFLGYRGIQSATLNMNAVLILAVVGYLLKLYLLSQGLYGRLVDLSHTSMGSNTSFLRSQTRFLLHFSILPFILICLEYFKWRTKKYLLLFLITLALELFFAFIYGARNPIVVVTLVVIITFYYTTQQFKLILLLPVPIALFLAFTVVAEFKEFAIYTNETDLSLSELYLNYIDYRSTLSTSQRERTYDDVVDNMVGRLNFTRECAIAFQYRDSPGLQESDPNFRVILASIPFDVVVPKFIHGVPRVSWGNWFKDEVLRRHRRKYYNVGFSPVGFLNFAGGLFAVVLGFFLYGVVLRATYQWLDYGTLGFIVFLLLVGTIGRFRTAVPGMLVAYVRIVIFYPLVLFMLFAPHQIGFLFNRDFWKLTK